MQVDFDQRGVHEFGDAEVEDTAGAVSGVIESPLISALITLQHVSIGLVFAGGRSLHFFLHILVIFEHAVFLFIYCCLGFSVLLVLPVLPADIARVFVFVEDSFLLLILFLGYRLSSEFCAVALHLR